LTIDDTNNNKPLECSIRMNDTANEKIDGLLFITQTQILFVSLDAATEQQHDMIIGAKCIQLHAMMEEPELAIYLQIGLNDEANDSDGEVYIYPYQEDHADLVFQALCKLISLHPVGDDDDDGEGDSGGAGLMSLLMGGDAAAAGGGGGGPGYSDEMVWAGSDENRNITPGRAFEDASGEAEDERSAMLQKLDNMLVVPPELEIEDGQFDDAEE